MPTPFSARRAGVLCPVFALRRDTDLGIGDTAAVRQLIDWAAETKLRFLQFLPINATGRDPSPYNAISSVALDPLTLDLSPSIVAEMTTAGFSEITGRHCLDSLRGPRVNYPAVRALKGELISEAFARLEGERAGEFRAFRQAERSWLDDFCLFRVLMDRAGHEDWPNWPDEFNTAAKARAWLAAQLTADPPATDRGLALHAYAQWLCATQWRDVRQYARDRGIGLMGDVPFGISWSSADAFFKPEQFEFAWCGGAPPETYFKDDLFVQKWGQNWGIPLYRWDAMKTDDFAWWRQRIRKLCEVFDIFRIDHVLGFYRIYSFPWRPQRNPEFLMLTPDEAKERTGGRLPHFIEHDDATPEHRAANLASGDARLRLIVEAAAGAEVVAEDLGTVPPYVRPHLLSLDIPGFKICHWEDDGQGHAVQGATYDNCSFATYATHDHEPMKTFWERRRNELSGHERVAETPPARELRYLCQFAWIHPEEGPYPPYDQSLRRTLLAALLESNARFTAFLLTDLFGLEDRFNVPGLATNQNWSARLPMTVGGMRAESPWCEEGIWLADAVARSGRA